jgi:hypothetical protein
MSQKPHHGWDGWLTPDGKFFPNRPSSLEFTRQRIEPRLRGLELSIHDTLALEYLETHRRDLRDKLYAIRRAQGAESFLEIEEQITPFMREHGFKPIIAQEWDVDHPPGRISA